MPASLARRTARAAPRRGRRRRRARRRRRPPAPLSVDADARGDGSRSEARSDVRLFVGSAAATLKCTATRRLGAAAPTDRHRHPAARAWVFWCRGGGARIASRRRVRWRAEAADVFLEPERRASPAPFAASTYGGAGRRPAALGATALVRHGRAALDSPTSQPAPAPTGSEQPCAIADPPCSRSFPGRPPRSLTGARRRRARLGGRRRSSLRDARRRRGSAVRSCYRRRRRRPTRPRRVAAPPACRRRRNAFDHRARRSRPFEMEVRARRRRLDAPPDCRVYTAANAFGPSLLDGARSGRRPRGRAARR